MNASNGNVQASQRIVLQSQARVEGNISTYSLFINDGATFEGNVFFMKMEPPPAVRANES